MARLIDADKLFPYGSVPFYADDGFRTAERIYGIIKKQPTVDAVEAEQYKALLAMYHELRENFVDYVCSGIPNVAPYCLNRCDGCCDAYGWCKNVSDKCHGFNPAEVILDGAKMDGDGNDT